MLALLQGLLPLFGGFFAGAFRANMEYKHLQMQILLAKDKKQLKSQELALQVKDKGVAWTRRFLAILFSCSLIGIVASVFLYSFLDPNAVVNVPRETMEHSFFSFLLPWIDPTPTTEYVQLRGLTIILPLIEPIAQPVLMIVGFYFGRK